jgi:hypothetical protein
MGDSKPGMLSDLVKGALTTAISVLVTYYVTSAIKKDQYQQSDADKEKQRTEAYDKTNKLLGDYVSRYDSLHTKYLALLEHNALGNSQGYIDETAQQSSTGNSFTAVSQTLISGNWTTPDGTIGWRFSGNSVTAAGIGSYAGFIEGSGSYSASGGVVTGTLHVTKAFYLPVDENLRFSFTVSSDGRVLYGTNTDNAGNVNAMTLYKN